MTNQIMQKDSNAIFKNIEQTADAYKHQFKKLAERAEKAMNSQLNSAKFEAAYALSVAKDKRSLTMKQVKAVREELWKEALKNAKGNAKIAHASYEKLCDFP